MDFNAIEVSSLLAKCHRRCCVCHCFCGVKIELDHVEPQADGSSDEIQVWRSSPRASLCRNLQPGYSCRSRPPEEARKAAKHLVSHNHDRR
jgi:hypothetical protein